MQVLPRLKVSGITSYIISPAGIGENSSHKSFTSLLGPRARVSPVIGSLSPPLQWLNLV
jgi:hypothetical protein